MIKIKFCSQTKSLTKKKLLLGTYLIIQKPQYSHPTVIKQLNEDKI